MRFLYPILIRFLLWVFLPLAIILVICFVYLRGSLPKVKGEVELAGLTDRVEVVRDEHGVPHITASTDRDAFFAMGYVHAQDRMWQMEIQRRRGSGRLAEVVGRQQLNDDIMMRTLGLYRYGKLAYEGLSDPTKQALQAYTDGVNAWIKEGHTLPPEYLIHGIKPEPWSVYDSMVVSKLVALNLAMNYRFDLIRVLTYQDLGQDIAGELLPPYPDNATRITASGLGSRDMRPGEDAELPYEDYRNFLEPMAHIGSNGWVVSGKLTESGMPLLANDPHLNASIPSPWYLVEMKGGVLHTTGVTLPGLPFVIFGHNGQISWGGVNLMADTQDLYYEHLDPSHYDRYEVNGVMEPMTVFLEQIRIKSDFPSALREPEEPVNIRVRFTRHGPMLSDVGPHVMARQRLGSPYSLRWTALENEDASVESLMNIGYAQDWDSFKLALRDYVAPALSFIYADKMGNIGYYGAGKVPIRARGEGTVPVPGWNDDYAWTGVIPFEELPHDFNPESGFLVAANNRAVPDDYPYHIAHDWDYPYRAERITELIRELIASGKKITAQDMAAIQGDTKSNQSAELLPYLLKVQPEDERQVQALEILDQWDQNTSLDSLGTTIYQAWIFFIGRELLIDNLEEPAKWWAQQLHPAFLLKVLAAGTDPTCDDVETEAVETCDDIVKRSLNKALLELEKKLGSDMTQWRWGRIHKLQFLHAPLSYANGLIRPFFHREIAQPGDFYSINVGPPAENPHHRFQTFFMSSYRQIIDLGAMDQSMYSLSPGESGNPLSDHYDDLMKRHRDVQYLTLSFGDRAVKGSGLLLQPQ